MFIPVRPMQSPYVYRKRKNFNKCKALSQSYDGTPEEIFLGNYSYSSYVDPKDRVTAYCKPMKLDDTKVTVYDQ